VKYRTLLETPEAIN